MYRVHFSAPVIYQAGHRKAERQILYLDVASPSEELARMHAIRTTQGEALITHVEEGDFACGQPPSIEVEPPTETITGAYL